MDGEGWLWFGELGTARQERLMGRDGGYSVGMAAGGSCYRESKDGLKAGLVGCRGPGKDRVSDDGPNTLSSFLTAAKSFWGYRFLQYSSKRICLIPN